MVAGSGTLRMTVASISTATARPGTYYAVADEHPIRLRKLTDVVTDAMQLPRARSGAPWLVGLFIGRCQPPPVRRSVPSWSLRVTVSHGWPWCAAPAAWDVGIRAWRPGRARHYPRRCRPQARAGRR
jgi:hypothetical protein